MTLIFLFSISFIKIRTLTRNSRNIFPLQPVVILPSISSIAMELCCSLEFPFSLSCQGSHWELFEAIEIDILV